MEKFLREIGLPRRKARAATRSNSRGRSRRTSSPVAPRADAKKFTPARDETAALTAQIQTLEHEIDQRVTALYGLPPSESKLVEESGK